MIVGDTRGVEVTVGTVVLQGTLSVPDHPAGLVMFAHGSGSSRFSSRNRVVARGLNGAGFATLLFDLLTATESERDAVTAEFRFDIPLLARRLAHALDWLVDDPDAGAMPIGLFGASTGAAAALITAAVRPDTVRAVVLRGGRPDLAQAVLDQVRAPTLLIVGGADKQVIAFNTQAARCMRCPHEVAIVPGATHLFEEPGALERVTQLATDWFRRHLVAPQSSPRCILHPHEHRQSQG